MMLAKFQEYKNSGSGGEFFLKFFTIHGYMGVATILVM